MMEETYLNDINQDGKFQQQPDYQLPEEPESSKFGKMQVKVEADSHSPCPKRRGRKPSQTPEEKRMRKILCDKNRRKQVKNACERLKEIEPEYNRLKKREHDLELGMKELRVTNEEVEKENKTLNLRVFELSEEIEMLRKEVHEKQEDFANMDLDVLDMDFFPGAEDWISLNHISASTCCDEELLEGLESSGSDKCFDKSLVESFIEQLNSKMKSEIDYSDFEGLDEELQTGGYKNFPSSLAHIAAQIKQKYGDIGSECTQSKCSALAPRILFHAAMREMTSLTLAQITKEKLLKWNNAIKEALNINFRVEFAKNQLEKIAYAYFGLAAQANNDDEVINKMNARITKLENELRDLKNARDKKTDELNFELRRQCIDAATYFEDQPLSKGLFC